MRSSLLAFAVAISASCAGAKPYHWEVRGAEHGPQTMCSCDGVAREPRPSEASTPDDPRIVLGMCEGRVYDCRPYGGRCRGRWCRETDLD